MLNLQRIILFCCLALVMGCSKPSDDEMAENLVGKWVIEYYDEYTRDSWETNEQSNGELSIHNELVGEIEFISNGTGVITDSAITQNFSWRVSEGYLYFDFPAGASVNDSHPIIHHFFNGGFCDPDVEVYPILRSEADIHVFRYRVGGSCSHETFHCLEWAITK